VPEVKVIVHREGEAIEEETAQEPAVVKVEAPAEVSPAETAESAEA